MVAGAANMVNVDYLIGGPFFGDYPLKFGVCHYLLPDFGAD